MVSVRKSEFTEFVVGKTNYSLSDVRVQQNIEEMKSSARCDTKNGESGTWRLEGIQWLSLSVGGRRAVFWAYIRWVYTYYLSVQLTDNDLMIYQMFCVTWYHTHRVITVYLLLSHSQKDTDRHTVIAWHSYSIITNQLKLLLRVYSKDTYLKKKKKLNPDERVKAQIQIRQGKSTIKWCSNSNFSFLYRCYNSFRERFLRRHRSHWLCFWRWLR